MTNSLRNGRWIFVVFAALLAYAPRAWAQPDKLDITPDVVYGHKDGLALTFDVLRPRENSKGVGLLFMVSGGWVSAWAPPEQMAKFVEPFLKEGYTVFAVRHGSSPRYVIPEIADDVRQALTYISDHAVDLKVDPKRLGVFGFSAGGHLSLLLGTIGGKAKNGDDQNLPRVAAVAAVFPPTDLAPYVDLKSPLREQFPALKFDPQRSDEFSPLKHVTSDDPPVLLVHGDKDELVPIWHSEKIRDALETVKVPSRLVVIEGAAHGFNAEGNKTMYSSMVGWFNQHLAAKQ